MARIAMVLPRSPYPPMTGRKAGIHAALGALAEENHEVDLLVLGRPDPARVAGEDCSGQAAPARRVVWLGMPGKLRALWNAGLSVLGARHSLNEALFRSAAVLARARRFRRVYDFAIADTIRAAEYADALGVPWHLDLDDLYSTRYRKYLRQPGALAAELLLGYYRENVPGLASALPDALVRGVLANEAARVEKRELYWARRATTLSLASPDEAQRLGRAASRRVHSSLMSSVRIPACRWQAGKASGGRAVFLGGLDYKPNLDALLYYQREVFPLLRGRFGAAAGLSHIGNAPARLRAMFSSDAVNFEGYVRDLLPRLAQASVFLAPVVSGSGIKTKVLEAMALGMPMLATREAVFGLGLEHKRHCFLCEQPRDFVEGMKYLGDPLVAQNIGLNARKYVEAHFSIEVLRQRWRRVIAELAASRDACAEEST